MNYLPRPHLQLLSHRGLSFNMQIWGNTYRPSIVNTFLFVLFFPSGLCHLFLLSLPSFGLCFLWFHLISIIGFFFHSFLWFFLSLQCISLTCYSLSLNNISFLCTVQEPDISACPSTSQLLCCCHHTFRHIKQVGFLDLYVYSFHQI